MSSNTQQSTTSLNVYMIFSRYSLNVLDELLSKHGRVGPMRVIFDSEGRETDRTVAVLESKFDDLLEEISCKEMSVRKYRFGKIDYPGENKTYTIFVPVPKCYTSETAVFEEVNSKIGDLVDYSILPDNSWTIDVPLASRTDGKLSGSCFINFNSEVTDEQIAAVRLLLNDSVWEEHDADGKSLKFKAFWARARVEKKKKVAKSVVAQTLPVDGEASVDTSKMTGNEWREFKKSRSKKAKQ